MSYAISTINLSILTALTKEVMRMPNQQMATKYESVIQSAKSMFEPKILKAKQAMIEN